MTILYNEKQSPLTIADYDINFTEIRDIRTVMNSVINQTDILNDDFDDIVQIINNLNNNHLKASNNLSDLQNITNSLLNLDIFSKTESDNVYFEIQENLSNIQNIIEVLSNLQIGTNALRDSYIIKSVEFPDPNDGDEGDIWFNHTIIIGT